MKTLQQRHPATLSIVALSAIGISLEGAAAKDAPAAAEETAKWSLVTTARGFGRFEEPKFETASVVVDTDKGTWRKSGKLAGARHQPVTEAAGFKLPAGASKPVFSASLKQVAYRLRVEGEERQGKVPARETLQLAQVDGTGKLDLLPLATIYEYAWSPDGKWLACSHDSGLTVFSTDDGAKALELDCAKVDPELYAHAARHLTWRPDSQAIAFRILFLGGRHITPGEPSAVAGDTDLFISDLGSKKTRKIALPAKHVSDPWTSLMPVRWQSPAKPPYQAGVKR